MGRNGALVLVFFVASFARAEDAPPFEDLGEADQTVADRGAAARKQIEADGLPCPDRLIAGIVALRKARAAREDGRDDDARAAYREAWTQFGGCPEAARERLAALEALRGKRPPTLRMGFKQKKAISGAFEWLAAHQDPAGCWDGDGFAKHDPAADKCSGAGAAWYDVGITALAVLAFVEAGYTDRDNHYAREVWRGLNWLMLQQDDTGLFGRRDITPFQYQHAITTLALAKAYARTKDERFRPTLEAAVSYTLRTRTAKPGGWRYEEEGGGETDTSVTAWCYRALHAAKEAGIEVDLAPVSAAVAAWIESMTGPDGQVGYNVRGGSVARPEGKEDYPADRSRSMTAAAIVLRTLIEGEKEARKSCDASLQQCLSRPPVWRPKADIDMYYWYYGTLACALDKKAARAWNKALHEAVLDRQHAKGSGAREGSWDPIGAWGAEGGRIYATVLMTLALLHAG